MKITRHIPNALTCTSLAFGFYAAILGLSGHYFAAMIAIFIAAIFDFSDGFAARLLKAYSPLGKELDSLADLISFGVAPGMMLFRFVDDLLYTLSWNVWPHKLFLLAAFIIPVLSALRLAKFNIDTRQTTSFLGLPVPAHAIFWSSLIVALATSLFKGDTLTTTLSGIQGTTTIPTAPNTIASTLQNLHFQGLTPITCIQNIPSEALIIALSITALATSLLLVSEIPMFSLKTTNYTWRANKPQYMLLIAAPILILLFGSLGIAATILLYILLSVILFRAPRA